MWKKFGVCLIYLLYLDKITPQTIEPLLRNKYKISAELILTTVIQRMKDSEIRVSSLNEIKQDHLKSAPFEIGYIFQVIQEKYRQMIDKYRNADHMMVEMYYKEIIMYLAEIEHHYWEIKHLVNMAHEIERKYGIKSINETYKEITGSTPDTTTTKFTVRTAKPHSRSTTRNRWEKEARNQLEIERTRKTTVGNYTGRTKRTATTTNRFAFLYTSTTTPPGKTTKHKDKKYRYPLLYGWDVPVPEGHYY